MLTIILLIVGIVDLAVSTKLYLTLKRICKNLNRLNSWHGIPGWHDL